MTRSGGTRTARQWLGRNGLVLAGDTWGRAADPLVLLLHGGGQTRHAWKGVGEALARRGYHVAAFDARGHGDSGWAPDGDYSLHSMVDDLVAVWGALGKPRVALVGASMGGLVSMVAAADKALDVAALMLVDVAPTVDPGGRQRILDFMRQGPDGFASLDEVADLIAAYQPHRERPKSTAGLAKNLRRMDNGRYRWHWDPAFHANASRWSDEGGELSGAARRLDVPVLLVRGELSDVLTEAGARDFLAKCPHAQFVTVRKAGHMVAGDENDQFGTALLAFLARHVPAHAAGNASASG